MNLNIEINDLMEKMEDEKKHEIWKLSIEITKSLNFCANNIHFLSDDELLERIEKVKIKIQERASMK